MRRDTFSKTELGFSSITRRDQESPAYTIASMASDRVDASAIVLPDGYTADTLDDVKWLTGYYDKSVAVSGRQALELRAIGSQILDLDASGDVQPPLSIQERDSIQFLLDQTVELAEAQN